MYYINKIVGFVLSPIGIAIVGGVFAWACAIREYRRAAKWLGWLTVVWLWLWMTPLMTWVVGVPLEREFLVDGRVPMVESFPEADAIVLLGGSMGIETNLSSYAEMWGSADRVWQAARLYKAGKAPIVIATGNGTRDSTLPLLNDFGVPSECVLFHNARNTEEEAKSVAEILTQRSREAGGEEVKVKVKVKGEDGGEKVKVKVKREGDEVKVKGKRVLLVTSAWHMKRARLMFEKYAPDVEVICAPADFENLIAAARPFSFTYFLPDPGAFMGNSGALHEWVGIMGYKLFR